MPVSMRQVAQTCQGRTGRISFTFDVCQYMFGLPNRPVSADLLLNTIKGRSFNLSVIFVGHNNDFSGTFSTADAAKVTSCVQRTRELYEQAGLGIRNVFWTHIPEADVGGYAFITDNDEAEDLTDDWSANNDGLDVFFVQNIGDAGGWSNVDGPCNKNSKSMSGSVVELSGGTAITGIITAHEVAHYLGLSHTNSATNLMGVDSNNDGIGEITLNSTNLTSSQSSTMRSHCSVKNPC